ncbi:MAG TPA: hypothetical protein PKN36_10280 [bacterium]|nr:hypothetical protein [bacterium]
MRRKAFFILLLFAGMVFAEEAEKTEILDQKALSEKITSMEKNVKKIIEEVVKHQKELQDLKKEIEQLKETDAKFTQVIRNLEIYVKSASSIRPDIAQWESVKAGMSSDDVEKVLGQPEEISNVRRVGTIWYYYGLGSITFNERGFVSERKTFKQYPVNRQ